MNSAIVSASKSSHKRGPSKNAHRKFQRRLAQHRTRMQMLCLDLYYSTPEWFDRSKAIADSIHRIEAIIRRVEAWRKSLPRFGAFSGAVLDTTPVRTCAEKSGD